MNHHKTNTLTIKTPEGIVFSLLLAGPVTRFLAWCVDLACVIALLSIVGSITNVVAVISKDAAFSITIFGWFAVPIAYGIATEWLWRGQTVGKRLLRLRVMDVQGLRLQLSQIVVRNLLRVVDMLPALYLVGGVSCLFSPKAQRLGDVAANTIVVRNPRISEPDLRQLVTDKFNSFRMYPHLGARLRQKVSPHEAGIALQALLRRNELDPPARVELFRDIASYFKDKVHFPEEAVEGIPDEQYVRNVVDIIYRTQELKR